MTMQCGPNDSSGIAKRVNRHTVRYADFMNSKLQLAYYSQLYIFLNDLNTLQSQALNCEFSETIAVLSYREYHALDPLRFHRLNSAWRWPVLHQGHHHGGTGQCRRMISSLTGGTRSPKGKNKSGSESRQRKSKQCCSVRHNQQA
jgi:hypothetical protein